MNPKRHGGNLSPPRWAKDKQEMKRVTTPAENQNYSSGIAITRRKCRDSLTAEFSPREPQCDGGTSKMLNSGCVSSCSLTRSWENPWTDRVGRCKTNLLFRISCVWKTSEFIQEGWCVSRSIHIEHVNMYLYLRIHNYLDAHLSKPGPMHDKTKHEPTTYPMQWCVCWWVWCTCSQIYCAE